jgi:hypothetical protein
MPHDREALERQLKTLEKRLKLLADDDAIREISAAAELPRAA